MLCWHVTNIGFFSDRIGAYNKPRSVAQMVKSICSPTIHKVRNVFFNTNNPSYA